MFPKTLGFFLIIHMNPSLPTCFSSVIIIPLSGETLVSIGNIIYKHLDRNKEIEIKNHICFLLTQLYYILFNIIGESHQFWI